MPTKQQTERSDMVRQMRETLNELISEQVVHALGSVDDLLGVHVRPLWKDHYRVNVFVGKDARAVRIASSYFLVVDGDGSILSSSPSMGGRYLPPVSQVNESPEVSC